MHAAAKRLVRNAGIGLVVAISLTPPLAIGAARAPVTGRDSPSVAQTSVRGAVDADKATAFDWLDRNADQMKALGLELWRTPELSFREFKSSRALIRYLAGNGFTVTANAADLSTAFVASSGSGNPVVAFWTEEDALAGMSQKAVPAREPVVAGGPGHACWHNLIGPSTVAAAVAVAQF